MTPEQIAQIEKIVERVLWEHTSSTQKSEKQLLAVLGTTQHPLDPILQQFQICMQEGWNFRIILSELATKVLNLDLIYSTFSEENILQENSITDIPTIVENYSQIVLPALSYPMAGKLAMKLVDTSCTYLIYHALCCGKRVLAAADISTKRKNEEKTIHSLDRIEPDHVNVLTEFGVNWITVDQIAASILEGDSLTHVNVDLPIISATVIANLADNVQELVYSKAAIITPLARDHAQKRGIKLMSKSKKYNSGL